MAGLITHFLVSRKAILSDNLDPGLVNLLAANSDWVFLGSASPDLPYVMDAPIVGDKTQTEWANHFHYVTTNALVIAAQKRLQPRILSLNNDEGIFMSWLLGYISHIITDITIHPIIEGIVGKYIIEANRTPHAICEKVQDSLLFNEVTRGHDITYAEYSDKFRNCHNSTALPYVLRMWKEILIEVYPRNSNNKISSEPNPESWFNTFLPLFDSADNPDGVVAMFRHAGWDITRKNIYESEDSLRTNYLNDCIKYYDKIKLPNSNTGSFKKDGYEIAIKNVVNVWNDFIRSFSTPSIVIANVIQDWDLDTGEINKYEFNIT